MTLRSKEALRHRRIALGAERKANAAAASDEPWAIANLWVYQDVMANAMAARSQIILGYLKERAERAPAAVPGL